MNTYDLKYKSSDNKNYYNIVLNLENSDVFQIKNASCDNSAYKFIENELNIHNYKMFFMGNDDFLNMNKIYKKYHKYFNNKEV